MNTDEEVDKESLKHFIDCVNNEYCIVYNQEYVNKLNKRIYELQKENGKLEGSLEDEKMEYYELENFKNNEIKELKDKAKKIIEYLLDYPYHAREEDFIQHIKEVEDFLKELKND